jgi:hypothetical protein
MKSIDAKVSPTNRYRLLESAPSEPLQSYIKIEPMVCNEPYPTKEPTIKMKNQTYPPFN